MTVVRDTTTSRTVSTGAAFKAWAKMISDALAGVGLVKTGDTGQIDLVGGTFTPAVTTFAGYEIWRFNDAAQSGDPIFFKIEYGWGNPTSRPALRITIGTGSDGAGTITNSTTAVNAAAGTTPSGTPELHICHIAGTLVFWESVGSAASPSTGLWNFVIERARDSSGAVITAADKNWYALFFWVGSVSGPLRSAGSWNTNPGVQFLGGGTGADRDSRKRFAPAVVANNYPGIGMLLCKSGELADGDSGVASVYSTSRNYRHQISQSGTYSVSATAPGGPSMNCKALLLNE